MTTTTQPERLVAEFGTEALAVLARAAVELLGENGDRAEALTADQAAAVHAAAQWFDRDSANHLHTTAVEPVELWEENTVLVELHVTAHEELAYDQYIKVEVPQPIAGDIDAIRDFLEEEEDRWIDELEIAQSAVEVRDLESVAFRR
ncbi:hypothetical protein [Streptacidiphilus cavernicola]|uniref:Uncharacterized protein n=1 Tax=Streptacidiphilus cavernicola TaxID=3342716 RepID=A0ABV6VY94_9ACTN